jgi:TolB-like protein/class 3 adenylate cyclase/Flp pilus assembly protein TadD
MSAEVKKEIELELAHVLFIDIVGYSKLLINDQRALLDTLNQVVRSTDEFHKAETAGRLIKIPTGDGMALVFYNTPEAPVECALEISRALKAHPELQLRMGVHSGPVSGIVDVNERANVAGAGINMAQRVMDCGDAGHILVSKHVAEDLEQYVHWQPHLHDLGECEVKHGVRVSVVNLYTKELGNPEEPEKFKAASVAAGVKAATTPSISKRIDPKWAMVGAVLLTAAAFAIGLLVFRANRSPTMASSTAPTPAVSFAAIPEKSIAVLPFENLSTNQENAFFADGVQDEILTDLAKIADLKVISRTSVLQYKNAATRNLSEIAKSLKVAHVLEGSVQRAVNRVRVNAQLIDARTDAHLWAQTYDRDLADVFAIQSEIAKTIADQLQAKLSPKEDAAMHEKPTTDMVAYDLYLKALEIDRNRASSFGSGGAEGAKRELDLLDQAVSRDPTFVLALCKLASVRLYLYWLNVDHTPERLDMARKALEAAARLQPDGGEVHLTRALFYYWGNRDYAPALAELALARRTLPNDPETFALSGYIERRQGNWEDSTRQLEQAVALDPRNIVLVSELAAQYIVLRRYDDATKTLDSALAWKPLDFSLGSLRANVDLDWKADLRRWKEVIASDAAKTADPNDLITARLGVALKERDYHGAERTLAAHGGAEFDDNGFFTPREWNQAMVARGLGDAATANTALLAARERAALAVRQQPEDGKALMVLAQIDAALGRKEDALREGTRAIELLPVTKDALVGDALLSRLAGIYAQVGETTRAFELLEKVSQIPFGVTYGSLKLDEIWDPLRGDARFEKIVASLAPKASP